MNSESHPPGIWEEEGEEGVRRREKERVRRREERGRERGRK